MKVGICCEAPGPWSEGQFLRRSAQAAERAGFSSYWFGDHVLLFGSYKSEYPYRGVASWAADEDSPPIPDPRLALVDPVMGMGWVAAATTTMEVGSAVLILPQRNPVVLAKQMICLDEFSCGRATLGVGVGWCQEEAEAIGVDWAARGKRTDEYIEVMRTLWRDDAARFEGPTVRFADAYLYPRPARGKLAIMVGGDSDVALRRVARAGDGWLAFSPSPAEMPAKIAYLRRQLREQGREADGFRISKAIFSWTTPDELKRYREAGVTEFLLYLCGELSRDEAELNAQLEAARARFVAPVADW